MGTDIYMYAECKKNARWRLVSPKQGFCVGRNYVLFSILANVQNRLMASPSPVDPRFEKILRDEAIDNDMKPMLLATLANFWKIREGWELAFIDFPRGLPKGLSPQLKGLCPKRKVPNGYHSASWLLLNEVLLFDWDKSPDSLNNTEDRGMTYKEMCQEFFATVVHDLLYLGEPDDIRIIFWFDS